MGLWTVWVAIQSWATVAGTYSAGGIARLVLGVVVVVVMGVVLFRQARSSTWDQNQLLRTALREGQVPHGADTASWRHRLRASVRQSDPLVWSIAMAYLGLLGGPLLVLSFGARSLTAVALSAAVGAVIGTVVAVLTVPYQRRTRHRAAALLTELES